MSYRKVTTGTGLAAVLTLVLAAAPGSALADKPFAGAALKWATLAGGTSIEELSEFVKPWEAETGATVEPVILPHPGFAEKVMLDAASGVHNYDLITLNYPKVGQFVEAGLVLALDDHIASDSARAIDAGDFIPRLLETYGSWKGMTYGFPLKADGRLMIYRTDVFEQHGKEPAKTWDEFLELAKYFNGTDWDGDGEAEFGAAYRFNAGRDRHRTVRGDAGRHGRAPHRRELRAADRHRGERPGARDDRRPRRGGPRPTPWRWASASTPTPSSSATSRSSSCGARSR